MAGVVCAAHACVPKTEYDDQRAKLHQIQEKLKALEAARENCNPDLYLELRDQIQSLDILTQELIDRNTVLSQEVARLKVYEGGAAKEKQECEGALSDKDKECEYKFSRTRATYNDFVIDLQKEIEYLKKKIETLKNEKQAVKKPKVSTKP